MTTRLQILIVGTLFLVSMRIVSAKPSLSTCEFLASGPVSSASGPLKLTCTVDGEKREALVYAPTIGIKGEKLPLVFAFHGHGGNMQGASQVMHIQTLWPGAIVVYPQGVDRPSPIDPNGNKPGWQLEANQALGNVGNKDLDFFDAMLAAMHEKFTVDNQRVYATGFSNGAGFSYLLWAERGQVLAAVGEVAGRLFNPPEHLTQPRAVIAIAGKMDTTDPFAKQKATIENDDRPVDNATGPGQPCPVPSGATNGTECTLYPSTTQTPVKTLIHPGAHVYPPWAPAEIVKFFKAHTQL
jgi:polyhydroxybutyrate depolymerase